MSCLNKWVSEQKMLPLNASIGVKKKKSYMLFTTICCMHNFLKIYHRSFVLFSVLWLIFPKFSSLLIIWLCLLTIYGAIKKQLVFKPNIALFAMMALFGAYLLSLFAHGAALSSLRFLENKLSLLIIPLIISFYPAKQKELIHLFRACLLYTSPSPRDY